MASSSWAYHALSTSVNACPSRVQETCILSSSSSSAGDHHPNTHKPATCCQLRALTSGFCPQLRKYSSTTYNPRLVNLRKGNIACNLKQTNEFSLKSSESRKEEHSSPSRRVLKALESRVVVKSSAEAEEPRKRVGPDIRPAGNAAPWRAVSVQAFGALLAGSLLFGVSSAGAVDALKTCACLLRECRGELVRCLADPGCAANVACLQTCNNRPDETECQIGCGDIFENSVVDKFNECAVTKKGCVPRKEDDKTFPIPPPSAVVQKFNTQDFSGKWYITSGFNKTFDTFDCQLHEFIGSPHKFTANLNWRIQTPDGGFFTRSAKQNFVQDEKQPGVLLNHGNEFLHYQDDWYILSAKMDRSPDDYVFVYYRGSNDAWDGYGGAVVYTRSSTLPNSIIPELTSAAKAAGLDFAKFTVTDNTCGPEAPLFARLEKKGEQGEEYFVEKVEEEELFFVQGLKQVVATVGQFLANIVNGEVNFFNNEAAELKKEEELLLQELRDDEKALLNDLNMGAKDIERLFGKPVPIKKYR